MGRSPETGSTALFIGRSNQAGTTTVAHYLDLLVGAEMVCGLPKHARDSSRTRALSRALSPKLQVLNTTNLVGEFQP
jgi:hypothetical protein